MSDCFGLRSDSSVSDRVCVLFSSLEVLGRDLAWCTNAPPALCDLDDLAEKARIVEMGYSVDSEEFFHLIRVRLLDILHTISDISEIATNLDLLVKLFFSFASLRIYNQEIILAIQTRISELMPTVTIQQPLFVHLLWSEAMLFNTESVFDIELDLSELKNVSNVANVVFAFCLMQKRPEIVAEGRAILAGSKVLHGHRAIAFANEFLQDGVQVGALSPSKETTTLPSWKYTFELCLACHGGAVSQVSKVQVSPLVLGMFPFDAMYGKTIVLELVRPISLIRSIDGTIIGVDGYTRMVRSLFGKKNIRIVAISVTEWTNLQGDVKQQVTYLKRRIRNCQDKRHLFSGTERGDNDSDDESSASSDMSY